MRWMIRRCHTKGLDGSGGGHAVKGSVTNTITDGA